MKTEFKGQLGQYKVVSTEDGSWTIWSEYFAQNCHSLAGATSETIFNYVAPCKIKEKNKHQSTNILEIGFGTGEGIRATLEALPKLTFPLTFVSTELDIDLVYWAMNHNNFTHAHFPDFKQLTLHKHKDIRFFHANHDSHQLYIIIGDATYTLNILPEIFSHKFDAFYQDAFSPSVNPDLWTTSWFKQLHSLATPTAILSTYSCAGLVRRNLSAAGWNVKKRKGFKQKREALIAYSHDIV